MSPTQAGLQLCTIINKCSLESKLAAMHDQLGMYLLQFAKMNSKLGLEFSFKCNKSFSKLGREEFWEILIKSIIA